jgi:endonuclease YncB( thermonuclease family)
MPVEGICRVAFVLGALLAPLPAWAAALPTTCAPTIEASDMQVVRAEKNGVLVLIDGRAVHLEGILLPQGTKDHAPAFLAEQAISTLSDLSRGRTVSLAVNIPKEDRYGRLRAQVEFPQDNDEPWLQIAMLRRGLARVDIAPDRRECAAALYAAEAEARKNKNGIWTQAAYTIRNPDQLAGTAGTFQVVEGKVLTANVKNGRAYLDFGTDWGRDFTATISSDDMPVFRDAGIDPRNYAGKMVRVRGFVDQMNGPEIELSSPDMVEVLVAP